MADQQNQSFGSRVEGTRAQRGFAAMDPAKQREIASKGGRAAHQKGTAHEFTSEEARVAGRKGGEASRNRLNAQRSNGSQDNGNGSSGLDELQS